MISRFHKFPCVFHYLFSKISKTQRNMESVHSKESLQRSSSYHSTTFCLLTPICYISGISRSVICEKKIQNLLFGLWWRHTWLIINIGYSIGPIPELAGRTWSAFVCFLNTLALFSGIEIDYYNLEQRISQLVIAIWKSMFLFVWKSNNYFPARVFHWNWLINFIIWWSIMYETLRFFNENKFLEI